MVSVVRMVIRGLLESRIKLEIMTSAGKGFIIFLQRIKIIIYGFQYVIPYVEASVPAIYYEN